MKIRFLALTTLAAALAACSSVPDRNAALDDARSRYNAAQGNANVTALAPDELRRAAEALRLAEAARTSGDSLATIDHLSYLTKQRVAIATETASSRAAQAVTAGAAAERDKMRLEMRTLEADAAQRQLAAAQQSNAQMSSQAEAAQRQLALSQDANARKTAELNAAEAARIREQERVARRDARLGDLEMQLRELNARKTERGMVVTLGDVLFDTGKSQLRGEGTRNLSKLADFFKRNPDRKASIEGYTDSVGSASSNMDLSERRASAVMSALVNMGVPTDRLNALGHGEEMPTASNDNAAGRQMNRRVEIVFTPLPGDSAMN